MHFLFVIAILLDVMKTDNWKTMKEENPAALCDLQQMVLSTAPIV
jgi:speckle-type POZ protein